MVHVFGMHLLPFGVTEGHKADDEGEEEKVKVIVDTGETIGARTHVSGPTGSTAKRSYDCERCVCCRIHLPVLPRASLSLDLRVTHSVVCKII